MKRKTNKELITLYINTKHKKYLGALYDRTVRDMYSYIYSRVGNKQVAEDITSDVFMTFIEIIDKYNGTSSVKTFLIGIAFNKIRQHWSSH